MESPEYCRQRAEEYVRLSHRAISPEERVLLLQMAQHWRNLAGETAPPMTRSSNGANRAAIDAAADSRLNIPL